MRRRKPNYMYDGNIKELFGPDGEIKYYEDLLLKRDQLQREANSIRISYLKEFGELTSNIFKCQTEIIKLKKTINAYQALINRNEPIDVVAIDNAIENEMVGYILELKEMVDDTKHAKRCGRSNSYEIEAAKRIYRKIAKRIHPDINKVTENNPELLDIWNQVMDAYYANDPGRLEELEVMINRLMKNMGDNTYEINIANIDEKIGKMQKQIQSIISSKPYIYNELLSDEKRIQETKTEMKAGLEESKNYITGLKRVIENLLTEGGATLTWQMN